LLLCGHTSLVSLRIQDRASQRAYERARILRLELRCDLGGWINEYATLVVALIAQGDGQRNELRRFQCVARFKRLESSFG
jgi:hypothetical protein